MCLTSYPTSAPILIPLEDAFLRSLCRVQASFPERERAERFPYASIPTSIISLTDGWRRCSCHRLTVCKRPNAQGAFLSVLSPSFGAYGFPSRTMIPQGVRLQEPQGTCRRCRDTLIAAQHRRRSCAPLPGARPCSREKEGKEKDIVSFTNFATFYLYSACRRR